MEHNPDTVPTTPPLPWRREVAVAAVALAFGLVALPFAIYIVGQSMLGEYDANTGALGLAENLWRDFFTLRAPAWILALSPYAILQVVRLVWRVWRPKL